MSKPKWFAKLICKYKGHDFETYPFRYGIYSDDVEMAGQCVRCGYDTHEKENC